MTDLHILSITKDLGFSKSIISPAVIKADHELILFDAGYPHQLNDFERELQKINMSISDITTIVISHHDHDHIGSLMEFKEVSPDVKIISSEIEANYISGKEESLQLNQAVKYNETLTGNNKIFGEQFIQYLKTIRQLIYFQYSKIIANAAFGSDAKKTSYGFIKKHWSDIIREDKQLTQSDKKCTNTI